MHDICYTWRSDTTTAACSVVVSFFLKKEEATRRSLSVYDVHVLVLRNDGIPVYHDLRSWSELTRAPTSCTHLPTRLPLQDMGVLNISLGRGWHVRATHTHTHTHTQYDSSRSYLKGWKAVVDRCIEIGYQIPRQHLVRPLLAIWSKKGHALVAPTSVARVRLLVSFISIPIPYIWINNMIYPREKLDNTHAVNYYRGGPSGSIILFTNHNDVKVVVVLNWKGVKKKAVRMW